MNFLAVVALALWTIIMLNVPVPIGGIVAGMCIAVGMHRMRKE